MTTTRPRYRIPEWLRALPIPLGIVCFYFGVTVLIASFCGPSRELPVVHHQSRGDDGFIIPFIP